MAASNNSFAGLSVKVLLTQRDSHADCSFPICAWRDATYQIPNRLETDEEEEDDDVSKSVRKPPINDSKPPTLTEEIQRQFERAWRIESLPRIVDDFNAGREYGEGGMSEICDIIDFTKGAGREDYRHCHDHLLKRALPLQLYLQEQERKDEIDSQRRFHINPSLRELMSKLACLADRNDNSAPIQYMDYLNDFQDPNPDAWSRISPHFDEIENLLRDNLRKFEEMARNANKLIRPLDQSIDHLRLSAGSWEFELDQPVGSSKRSSPTGENQEKV